MRLGRVERLLRVIRILQAGRPRSVDELADMAGVSRRTTFRDLKLLQRAGMPYRYDRGSRSFWTEHGTVLPPLTLSPAEALGLLLAVRQHQSSHVSPDAEAAAAAALKVESMLPRVLQDYVQPRLKHVELRPEPASDAGSIADMLSILQSALARTRKVWIRYDSYFEGKQIERTLRPYRLAYIHRGWYLIAYTDEQAKMLTYKVERIIEIRTLRERYTLDPGFSLDDYFGNAWLMIRGDQRYHVQIRFLPKVAGNVDEVLWHRTQQTRNEPDGSLIFEVDVDGIEEIGWWVLGYGDQAQVLQPAELRVWIAEHAARMLACYRKEPAPPAADKPSAGRELGAKS